MLEPTKESELKKLGYEYLLPCHRCESTDAEITIDAERANGSVQVIVKCPSCGCGVASGGQTAEEEYPNRVIEAVKLWNKYFGKKDREPTELEQAISYFTFPPKTPYDSIVLKALKEYQTRREI